MTPRPAYRRQLCFRSSRLLFFAVLLVIWYTAPATAQPPGGVWSREARSGGETWKYTFTVKQPAGAVERPVGPMLAGLAGRYPAPIQAPPQTPTVGTALTLPSRPISFDAGNAADQALAGIGMAGIGGISGQLPAGMPGAQIGVPASFVKGVQSVRIGDAQEQVSPASRADNFPGPAVATLDIIAQSAYMRSAASGGGVLLDPPGIGATTYFYVDFQISGTGGPVTFQIRAVLDTVTFCAGQLSSVPLGSFSTNCGPWTATSGLHTIQWDLDYTGAVEELSEVNNSVSKSFTPSGQDLVAQISYMRTATAGGGSIVDPPNVGQTVFFHVELLFNGTGGTVSVTIRAVLDGGTWCSGSFMSAPPSASTSFCNNGWIATAGAHTLQWDLDYNNTISEISESNNSASKAVNPGTGNAGLTITPTFDPAVSVAEQALIYSTIAFYRSTFTDPVNVLIKFQRMASGLGQSQFNICPIAYSVFNAVHRADANPASADDTLTFAGGRLPVNSSNPVTGSSLILVKPANARALGIGGCTSGLAGGVDGIISFNSSLVDLNGGVYSLFATIQHEIDEVMGLGSAIPSFTDPYPEDLFRYGTAANVRNFVASAFCPGPTQAFFSIDGTAHINEFNNCTPGGDYGDWITHTPSQVQDAITNGSGSPFLTITSDEVRALDVIGYNVLSLGPRRHFQLTGD